MGYQEDWDQLKQEDDFKALPADKQREIARFYARKVVRPAVSKGSPELKDFISKNILEAPKPQSARTRDHLLPQVGETVVSSVTNPIGFAKGAVKGLADDSFSGQATRLARRADKAMGSKLPYRDDFRHFSPEDHSRAEEAGRVFGQSIDPLAVALPINALAGAAKPVVSAGLNLLPKAAPSATLAALKAAAGTGLTQGGIGAAASVASQVNENQPINPQAVAEAAMLQAAFGAIPGAIGAAAPIVAKNRAIARGATAAEVQHATGQPHGTVRDTQVTGRTISDINAAHALAAENHGAASELDDAALVAAVMDRSRRHAVPGILQEDITVDSPFYEGPSPQLRGNPLAEVPAVPAHLTPAVKQPVSAAARVQAIEAPREVTPQPAPVEKPTAVTIATKAPEPKAPEPMDFSLSVDPEAQARIDRLVALNKAESEKPVGGGLGSRLLSEESGTARMPSPDEVRAAANQAVDTGLGAVGAVARITRPVDHLIERAIGATRVDVPVRAAAGLVRRGKDAAKERLRTGITGGASEAADKAGQFFVSSKAPIPYQDLKDRIRSQTTRQMQGLTDEAARLEGAGVNQEALHDIVTDGSLSSPEAEAVRARTNQVSRDLLDVGALTPQQQAKWDNQYLPRSYAGKDSAVESLARVARKAVTLSGAKRRGKVEEISPHTLAVRQKPWEEVGVAADGRVMLRDRDTGETMAVSRKAAGNFTGEWSSLGAAKGGKVKAWRDWTPTEREAMGELKNVSHALRKLARQAYGDLNNGRLLKAVSENPEWAVRDVPGQPGPEGWILFDKKTVKSNGAYRWGALADHWVEPSIAADLAAATNNDALGQVVKILRTYTGINQFKKVKVVYNPASHGNQLMQNMITLEAAGGSVADMPRAAQMLRVVGGPTIAQLRELGLYGDDFLATEGMSGAGSSEHLDWGAMAGIARVPQWLDEASSDLYEFSDNVTRTAFVLGKLDEGVDVADAVRLARESFYNGNTVNSGFARLGSASLLPFVKPALYTFDKLPDLIEANPVKAVKLLAYWLAFDQGMKALSGHLNDEDGRQALLADYQKGVGKTAPMPITDTRGQQLLFDYQRMNPAGSAFGINDRTGFGPVPEALVPLGGTMGGVLQALANRDLFRDEPLRTATKNDTPGFLAGHFLPGFTANGQRLGRAVMGQPEADGETQYDVPTALANVVGVKVQPFNPQKGYDKNARGFMRERDDLILQARRNEQALARLQISQGEHDARMADLENRMNDLTARFEAWDRQAQQGLRAFGGQR